MLDKRTEHFPVPCNKQKSQDVAYTDEELAEEEVPQKLISIGNASEDLDVSVSTFPS